MSRSLSSIKPTDNASNLPSDSPHHSFDKKEEFEGSESRQELVPEVIKSQDLNEIVFDNSALDIQQTIYENSRIEKITKLN